MKAEELLTAAVLKNHESNASDSSHPFACFEDAGSCLFSVLTLDKGGEVEVGLHPPTLKLLFKLLAGYLTQAVPKQAAVDDRGHCSSYIIFIRGSKIFCTCSDSAHGLFPPHCGSRFIVSINVQIDIISVIWLLHVVCSFKIKINQIKVPFNNIRTHQNTSSDYDHLEIF